MDNYLQQMGMRITARERTWVNAGRTGRYD